MNVAFGDDDLHVVNLAHMAVQGLSLRVHELAHDARVELALSGRVTADVRVVLAHVHEQVVATGAAVFAHDARVQAVALRVAVLHAYVLVQVDQLREAHRAEVAREQLLLVAEIRQGGAAFRLRLSHCHGDLPRVATTGTIHASVGIPVRCLHFVLRLHVASDVLFLSGPIVTQRTRERPLVCVCQQMALQSALTVSDEAALLAVELQLRPALVELLVLFEVFAGDGGEATVRAAQGRLGLVDADLMLPLEVDL